MITVIGSINMDVVVETNLFPKQGETVLGRAFIPFQEVKEQIKRWQQLD